MATTYNNLYLDTRGTLLRAGVAGASLEARELVCYAADKTREEFLRDKNLYVPAYAEEQLLHLLRRRLDGEPVAYLIGEWEFYGIALDISPAVLVPRVDTELLAAKAIQAARGAGEGCRVLDLCCGSGCIGLAVAKNVPACRAVLADLSEDAIRVARQNVRRSDLHSRVTVLRADASEPPPVALGEFHVLVCNPPYIPTAGFDTLDPSVRRFEPRMALDGGADGLDFYRSVAGRWARAIRQGGRLLFEVGLRQADPVEQILARLGYSDIATWPDDQGILRVVEATMRA